MRSIGFGVKSGLLMGVLCASQAAAWAYGPQLQYAPEWLDGLTTQYSTNNSFLSSPDYAAEGGFLSTLMDRDLSEKKRIEYERMVDAYERQRHHGQRAIVAERAHYDRLSSFSKGLVSEVRRSKVKVQTEKLHDAAESTDVYDDVKAPVGIAAALFAIYNGKMINMDLEKEIKLEARTDVPDKAGEFKLTSPLVDSAVRFQFADQNEDSVTASLSRRLTDNVRCVFDASKTQESIRLEYGFRF